MDKPSPIGKNKVFCFGRFLTGPSPPSLIICEILLLGFNVAGIIIVFPLIPWWAIILEVIVCLIFPHILFYATACSDPGIIPRAEQLPPDHPYLRPPEPTVGNKIGGKYCRVCKIYRPLHAKHCYDCDNCVLFFDHHCGVVNNCIGARNHGLFAWWLISCSVGCLVYVATCIVLLIKHGAMEHPALLIFLVMCGAISLPPLGFGFWNLMMICRDRTTASVVLKTEAGTRSCWAAIGSRLCSRIPSLIAPRNHYHRGCCFASCDVLHAQHEKLPVDSSV
eukprot:gnl/Trimastix_PCT/1684.p1 GENE.gnl/Trimastix_PCT/1684~~gnl/Trimastix_PCT/1684.p1  ORF type:complete len:303 (+),score=16.27 gnl/Trimastix_PCT/1684:78-911(+)